MTGSESEPARLDDGAERTVLTALIRIIYDH